jgi:hypothetical protein
MRPIACRTLGKPVAKNRHAALEDRRVGEDELRRRPLREQQIVGVAIADEERVDPEPQLVQKTCSMSSVETAPNPYWTMSWPGSSFNCRIRSATSLEITAVFAQSGSVFRCQHRTTDPGQRAAAPLPALPAPRLTPEVLRRRCRARCRHRPGDRRSTQRTRVRDPESAAVLRSTFTFQRCAREVDPPLGDLKKPSAPGGPGTARSGFLPVVKPVRLIQSMRARLAVQAAVRSVILVVEHAGPLPLQPS